jgi:hypothetical protein
VAILAGARQGVADMIAEHPIIDDTVPGLRASQAKFAAHAFGHHRCFKF